MILGAANLDLSNIIGTCILVISVLSWFVNLVQSNRPKPDMRLKPPRPKPPSAPSEIEILLQQLTGEKPKPKPKPKPERREQPGPRAQTPRPPKPPKERGRNPANSPGQRGLTQAPLDSVASRSGSTSSPLPSANLGGEIRSHQIGNRVDAAVQNEITTVVQKDLGVRDSTLSAAATRPTHPMINILRDPQGVRQAILLNEILQRPKALRRGA